MPRFIALLLSLSALLLVGFVGKAHAAGRCGDLRVSLAYANKIRATNVGCGDARGVARGYTSCRNAHAARSRCHHVGRYGCSEGRRTYGGGEFYSNVTCRRGGRRVSFVSSRI